MKRGHGPETGRWRLSDSWKWDYDLDRKNSLPKRVCFRGLNVDSYLRQDGLDTESNCKSCRVG